MIVDSHVHIGSPPQEAEPEIFAKILDRSKISKAVVFRYFYGESTAAGNKYIQAVAAKYPNHFIGFAWIDPNEQGAVSELKDAIMEWGLRGVKLHLELHPSPLSNLRAVFKEAQNLAIPIIVHLGDDFEAIDVLSQEFDVTVIIAHLGTGVYRLEIDRLKKALVLARHENVFLETSGNTYPFVDYAVRALGPCKIILGSDFPHEHPLVSAKIVDLLDLPAEGKEQILSGNISEILQIK